MSIAEKLWSLERDAWTALSSGEEASVAFYGEVLAAQVLMLLSGG